MSQILKAILATVAVSGTLGAVQLASGHDLIGRLQLAATEPAGEINRAAKADRAALRAPQSQTQTITIRSVGLEDTSVVVRVPVVVRAPIVQAPVVETPMVTEQIRNRPAAPAKPGASKMTVACEPPVSVLTEVAKLLQPGRCVT
jgi:hypothetical protein